MHAASCQGSSVGNFAGIGSLLPSFRFKGSNSGHLAWQQASSLTESSHWPTKQYLKKKIPGQTQWQLTSNLSTQETEIGAR